MQTKDMFGSIDYRLEILAAGTYPIVLSSDVVQDPGKRCFVKRIEMNLETSNGQIIVQEEGGGKIHFETEAGGGKVGVQNEGFGSKNNAAGTGLEVTVTGPGPFNFNVHVTYNLQPDA